MSEPPDDPLTEAIVALVPALLNALEALGFVSRHMHPPRLAELARAVEPHDAALRQGLERFRAIAWPEQLERFRTAMETVADATCQGFDGLRAAAAAEDGVLRAYRALRQYARAAEVLYPVAQLLPAVSRFFLEPGARGDADLLARLARADPSREGVGVLHADNEPGTRGGFSLYVPETYDPARAHPLIVAMHGGSGHGRGFLWSWLREARGRGAILLSPTAAGGTWSLMDPEIDSVNLDRMLAFIRERWNIDTTRLLLTGMSDGGTFSLVSGLRAASPFTHLAPIAASFHPMLLHLSTPERIAGLPIYLVHGVLDWMFPVAMARAARQAFEDAGARVTYREIADLSHTYPREENAAILDWFLA